MSLPPPGPVVLGIVNVTPDSFSDGGRYLDPAAAVRRAEVLMAEGADMVDIGGESTRPGADRPSVDEELRRVVPVVEAVAESVPVSIDTRSEEVARAAVAAGASIINDISAELGPLAAELGVGWIATHMQGDPATMQDAPRYDDVVDEVCAFLDHRASAAAALGVERLWIDPGFGFGKSLQHNVQLLAKIDRVVATGWPVAVGTSRKSMIGRLIADSDGVEQPVPVDDRLVGSVATATYALACGAELLRVHDVKAARQAVSVVTGRSPSQSRS
ncbi:MAG: dihydropteroate synthase [Actinomycetota bacterium]